MFQVIKHSAQSLVYRCDCGIETPGKEAINIFECPACGKLHQALLESDGRLLSGKVPNGKWMTNAEASRCPKGGYPFGEPPYLPCILEKDHDGNCVFEWIGEKYESGLDNLWKNRKAVGLDRE